jgi:hypothetical protein
MLEVDAGWRILDGGCWRRIVEKDVGWRMLEEDVGWRMLEEDVGGGCWRWMLDELCCRRMLNG